MMTIALALDAPADRSPADALLAEARSARADDGTELRWFSHGSGETVLLLQGQATSALGWEPVARRLATEFRVIRLEQRGIAGTDPGDPDELSTRTLASDARAVLDAAGIEVAHVVGHSMGGKVAQWVAIDAPERVQSLSLLATSLGESDGEARDEDAFRIMYGGTRAERSALFFHEHWASAHLTEVRQFFTIEGQHPTLRALKRATQQHDTVQHAGRITAPTIVLHGDGDRIVPQTSAELLADTIAGADLRVFEDQLHGLHLESDAAITLVHDFIAANATD